MRWRSAFHAFDWINPATGQVLTQVAACEQAGVDAAVTSIRLG